MHDGLQFSLSVFLVWQTRFAFVGPIFSKLCRKKNRSLLCLLLAWSLLEAESAMATMTMTQTAETETTGEMSVSSSSCGAWDFLNHTFGAW